MGRAIVVRGTLVAAFAVALVVIGGCCAPKSLNGPCCDMAGIPPDLPAAPDPCKKYCKVWVPATYKKVPKLVRCCNECTKQVPVRVKEMRAREVMVKPRQCVAKRTCGNDCEDTLIQVKPGGYRWEQAEAGCWQYCYRKPEYKWCKRQVKENEIAYCVETPPEYKTVVETRDVVRYRTEYVPPKYEIRYVNEVHTPGHWAWKEAPGCGAAPDRRCWTKPRFMGRTCTDCNRKPAIDCGCPPTN